MNVDSHIVADQIVVFSLDEHSYALSLSGVVRIIHAIEIRPVPDAPEIISGIINIKGRVIPVADIRWRFGLPVSEINPDNHIIITDTGKREIAILVDSVTGIRVLTPDQIEPVKENIPFAGMLKGIAKVDDSLILIYDLEGFLSLEEEKILDNALIKEINES